MYVHSYIHSIFIYIYIYTYTAYRMPCQRRLCCDSIVTHVQECQLISSRKRAQIERQKSPALSENILYFREILNFFDVIFVMAYSLHRDTCAGMSTEYPITNITSKMLNIFPKIEDIFRKYRAPLPLNLGSFATRCWLFCVSIVVRTQGCQLNITSKELHGSFAKTQGSFASIHGSLATYF